MQNNIEETESLKIKGTRTKFRITVFEENFQLMLYQLTMVASRSLSVSPILIFESCHHSTRDPQQCKQSVVRKFLENKNYQMFVYIHDVTCLYHMTYKQVPTVWDARDDVEDVDHEHDNEDQQGHAGAQHHPDACVLHELAVLTCANYHDYSHNLYERKAIKYSRIYSQVYGL